MVNSHWSRSFFESSFQVVIKIFLNSYLSKIDFIKTSDPSITELQKTYKPKSEESTNKFSSIFGQILQIFSKREFYEAVAETKAKRKAKVFTCMAAVCSYAVLPDRTDTSLLKITGGLTSSMGKLKHLEIDKALKGSTLSYANEHRPWSFIREGILQATKQVQDAF